MVREEGQEGAGSQRERREEGDGKSMGGERRGDGKISKVTGGNGKF